MENQTEPGYGSKSWEVAYRKWRTLADKGYGERCNTRAGMERVDNRIRAAKAKYEKLLAEAEANASNSSVWL